MREDLLVGQRRTLVDKLDCEHGLLNELEDRRILTHRQRIEIEACINPYEKNEKLLDELYRRPDSEFGAFCDALCSTNQAHIVVNCFHQTPPVQGRTPKKQPVEQPTSFTDVEGIPRLEKPQQLKAVQVKTCDESFYLQHVSQSYQFAKPCRGKCVIINNYDFDGMLAKRQGADVDCDNLTSLFQQLHFDVIMHKNLTAQDIKDTIESLSHDSCLRDDDGLVLFIMSHGNVGSLATSNGQLMVEYVLGTDNKEVLTSELINPLTNDKCKYLKGKPRLVFFQMCRGDEVHKVRTECDSVPERKTTYKLNLKDFIIGYPTQLGYRSFRNSHYGSWYVMALVHVFMHGACTMDVSAMLRKVNEIVCDWMPEEQPNLVCPTKGQVSQINDNLTKPYLYLFPGIQRK